MLADAHDRLRPILANRDRGFRWRGGDISRIEGLSDAVFAFAMTLLVVSLEVPKTYVELAEKMRGFVGFAACFALLILIWHTQYIWFRRYGLEDRKSFLLNAALLFVVAFYIYPLKFLFTTFIDLLTGHVQMHEVNGVRRPPITWAEWRPLMMIYSLGFTALYTIFTLLYSHAWRLRDALELNEVERFDTRTAIWENVVMIGIGAIGFALAVLNAPQLSGLAYALIGPVQTTLGFSRGARRKRIGAAAPPTPSAAAA